MKIAHYTSLFAVGLCFCWGAASAQEPPRSWVDRNHAAVKDVLQFSASTVDSWFGPPQTNNPASAQLRILIDNTWDRDDGYSIKPRLRGRLRLPNLENRLHLVFGDESVDEEFDQPDEISSEYQNQERGKKTFDYHRATKDNGSLGLQLSLPKNSHDWRTKLGVGARSNGDIYAKAQVNKMWYHSTDMSTRAEIVYRYGSKSEHHLRNNLTFTYAPTTQVVTSNQLRVEYRNRDRDDQWSWGNSLSRKHPTGNETWYNYGLYVGGDIADNKATINTYGPFVGLRERLYSNWLFVQPEVTFYNNRNEDKGHQLGVTLRIEAQF